MVLFKEMAAAILKRVFPCELLASSQALRWALQARHFETCVAKFCEACFVSPAISREMLGDRNLVCEALFFRGIFQLWLLKEFNIKLAYGDQTVLRR